jgi:FKBP-type peptidyl-prolyl cis-trans isomerase FkpA
MKIFNRIIVVFLLVSTSCNSQQKKNSNDSIMQERIIDMNKARIGAESRKIDSFISEKNFHMLKTGTGLRYEIYQKGNGLKPVAHNLVELKYKVYLLNGMLCYSSDSSGNAKFRLGEGGQVRGLEEGVLLMQGGDKARLVLPNHLAFGLQGDEKKIPPAQPVFFDIEIVKVDTTMNKK